MLGKSHGKHFFFIKINFLYICNKNDNVKNKNILFVRIIFFFTGIPNLQGVGNMQIQYSNGSNSYFKRANFTFSKEFKLLTIF